MTREAAEYEFKPRPMPAKDDRLAKIRERAALRQLVFELELLHDRSAL